MKKDTHPTFYQAQVICACGNEFKVGTTIEGPIRVETCYQCHPFYTGKQKLVDTAGRVDRFRQKAEAAKKIAEDRAHGISAPAKAKAVAAEKKPATKAVAEESSDEGAVEAPVAAKKAAPKAKAAAKKPAKK